MKKVILFLTALLSLFILTTCENEKGKHIPDALATSLLGCWQLTEGEEIKSGTLDKQQLIGSNEFRMKYIFNSDKTGFIIRNNSFTPINWFPNGTTTIVIYPDDEKENYEIVNIIAVLDDELFLQYKSTDNMHFEGSFDRSDVPEALYNRSKFVGSWKVTELTGWNMEKDKKYPIDPNDLQEKEIWLTIHQTSFSTIATTNKKTEENTTENFFWTPLYDFVQTWPYKGNQNEDSSIYYVKEVTDYTLILIHIEEDKRFLEITLTKR